MALTIGRGITIGGGITFAPTLGIVTNGLVLNVDAGDSASYPGTGTTWYDISGAGNNATLQGSTPWYDYGNQSYFTFISGFADAGYILSNTAYTKVGMFRVAGSYANFISGNANNSQHAFWGAGVQYLQSGHNGNWYNPASPVPTPLNQWVFGAVSFSSTTGWRLYLNNNTVVTNADTAQFVDNPAQVLIGAFDGSNNLGGDVGAVLIYDRVLSDSEIAQNYAYYHSRFNPSFTLSSADFTAAYGNNNINFYTNTGFEVTAGGASYGPSQVVYAPNVRTDQGGNPAFVQSLVDLYNSQGWSLNDTTERVFNVTWAAGSTVINGLAYVGFYYNTPTDNQLLIGVIDAANTAWQTPGVNTYNGSPGPTTLVGTFNLPATFSLYTPEIDAPSNWC